MESIRIYEIPACKMVSSGVGMFGDDNFDRFDAWLASAKGLPNAAPQVFPRDYLTGGPGGFEWLYLYEDGMDTAGFAVVDFPGGLYAVVTGIDGQSNRAEMAALAEFIAAHGLERDPDRAELGNVITSPAAKAALGYEQMDYFVPVRAVRNLQ